jgi:triosephosphate isomerase (TIM)
MRKPYVAGNWKMNLNLAEAKALVEGLKQGLPAGWEKGIDVAVCPPYYMLVPLAEGLKGSQIGLGAQNCYFEPKGAFTGEISPAMLKDVGCTYVLCGHSERRHVIKESDELVGKKVNASISGGLLPILCVGELLEQRDAGQTEQVVERHLRTGLAGLGAEKVAAVTIAYEPVWAIGTGRTATRQQAQEVHQFIRALLAKMYGRELAEETRILYGGSVKPDNAGELMAEPDVDGLLVGGASLKADDFVQIIHAAA